MRQEIPDKIGPYPIDREIGRGGMGVVYLGHDPKLGRPVAIKALSTDVSGEPERMARFAREARVLASLSHGNIATVYGFEEVNDERYLVMEFVEGETLGERLGDGAMSLTEALAVCAQIAAGVEAAHDAGIIHRDLKPGNVIIRPDGTPKVLDFGLAREMPTRESHTDLAAAATVKPATGVTAEGVSIGTPGYMSPEQVRGRSVDRRTDTFAFGCILYECLTGHQAFPGETATDSVAAILEREPDWSRLPDGTPPTVQLLLRRCLQKDRRRRLRNIGDARIEIEQAIDDPTSTSLGLAEFALRSTRAPRVPKGLWAGAALVAVAAAAAAWFGKPAAPPPRPTVARMALDLDVPGVRPQATFAPDGSSFVFVAEAVGEVAEGAMNAQLWLRRLDAFEPTPIPGTEGGAWPVFSPDSRRVLFVAGDQDRPGRSHEAELRVVGLDGRPPLTIASDALDHAPPIWLTDDEVAYIHGTEMQQVHRRSARGGEAQLVSEVDDDTLGGLFRIDPVPGGRWIALSTRRALKPTIHVVSIDGGEAHRLLEDAISPSFVRDDVMLFGRSDALLATRLVPEPAGPPRTSGELVVVLSGAADKTFFGSIAAFASASGHLAYVPSGGTSGLLDLATVDLDDNVEPFPAEKQRYMGLVGFSPDGTRLAYTVMGHDEMPETWVMDLDTGATRRRSAPEALAFGGAWLADGRLVYADASDFASVKLLVTGMRRRDEPEPLFADGLGDETLDLRGVVDPTPDGEMLYLTAARKGESEGIYVRPLDGSSPPRPVVATPTGVERRPRVSPDGRWLAFVSDESGRLEVYVRPVDAGAEGDDRITRISRTGGRQHFWSSDGGRIFFKNDEALHAVDIDTSGGTLAATEPRELFRLEDIRAQAWTEMVPMLDGERLLFVQEGEPEGEEAEGQRIDVILNWVEELEWER